jgi:hypothetical protein
MGGRTLADSRRVLIFMMEPTDLIRLSERWSQQMSPDRTGIPRTSQLPDTTFVN